MLFFGALQIALREPQKCMINEDQKSRETDWTDTILQAVKKN